ncbi:MAG: 50S ribosomal protein L24 [Myxococcaceae bacterium]
MEKLKVGDTVEVMKGAERTAAKASKRGKIISINREANRLQVEGLRLVKKHVKKGRDRANPEGGIIEKAGTIALASVALVCPKCDAATRVGVKADGDKKKRFCKKCDATID